MSNQSKLTHYNLDELDRQNATINILYSERSAGKSYQVKHKKGVLKYLETGRRFILMRRFKEEIRSDLIEQYFTDVDVHKITDGKYNCITVFKKALWLSYYDPETGKTTRGEKIGYVVALSTEQNYAGGSYLDVDDIIFEEFMSRSEYLANEPDKLMNFRSTVDRKRNAVRLWLVGNTISRINPYIHEWGLQKIVSQQKQGTIESVELPTGTYDNSGNEITVKCCIEYCPATGNTSYAIGKHKDMLNKGSWQSDPQPKLPKSYNEYKVLFRIFFVYQGNKFAGEYLMDKDKKYCWFVKPYLKNIYEKNIVVSDIIKVNPYWIRDIYNANFRNERINNLLKSFTEEKIFYASDLCGTDFKQVIDFNIRRS